ncbi:MAG: hypothetical protein V5A43_04960 [Haloarculaceae archaeon]
MAEYGEAVTAECADCGWEGYVTDEPAQCPYCNGDLAVERGVVVRPH